jgi:hypothetical protein
MKAAGASATEAYQRGAERARRDYDGDVYWLATSNRFVSRMLKTAGIQPTAAMFDAIGYAPGIQNCFYW